MENKKVKTGKVICISILTFIIVILSAFALISGKIFVNNDIPEDYIFVFHGGAGEMTYYTYIYKIDNNQANYGFEYINTVNVTKSWGSTETESKVIKRGKVDWTDSVFSVAKEHGAYDYVVTASGENITDINKLMERFIMN